MDYIYNVRACVKHSHKNKYNNENRKEFETMSKKAKTYGVVITTNNGVKVMGIYADEYPTKSRIKSCLRFELHQELEAIQTRGSGWHTLADLNKKSDQAKVDYKDTVRAINMNNYKVKVLG